MAVEAANLRPTQTDGTILNRPIAEHYHLLAQTASNYGSNLPPCTICLTFFATTFKMVKILAYKDLCRGGIQPQVP